MVIIEIKDLNLYYGENYVLKNINIKINEKVIIVLIGLFGCGKFIFLRILNRMNDFIENVKIEGNVYFEGKDIYKEIDVIMFRKKIGMVF